MNKVTTRASISETRALLCDFDGLTGQSIRRVDEIAGRFESFVKKGFGINAIAAITSEHVEEFVRASGHNGKPSVATMHVRRSSLRLLFRIARSEFGLDGDPTLDLRLPPRSTAAARPLTDDEVALGRSYSLHNLDVTRLPAAWSLGEATATTAELPHITIDDLDLDDKNGPRVWLHGSRKREERWGLLDNWGAAQLERRAKSLKLTKHLIYQGSGSEESQQASCCIAIKETMVRAGLDAEPDVRPSSLMSWAGVVVHEQTNSIEEVARRLGIRSLDIAARFINYDWK
jgi:site-specific recombinase XerD